MEHHYFLILYIIYRKLKMFPDPKMVQSDYGISRPFQERHAIAHTRIHTSTKAFRGAITCANQTFDYTILLLNSLCFIKMCPYSHGTKYTDGCH